MRRRAFYLQGNRQCMSESGEERQSISESEENRHCVSKSEEKRQNHLH